MYACTARPTWTLVFKECNKQHARAALMRPHLPKVNRVEPPLFCNHRVLVPFTRIASNLDCGLLLWCLSKLCHLVCLNRKQMIAFGLWICLGIISVIGLGFPCVVLVFCSKDIPLHVSVACSNALKYCLSSELPSVLSNTQKNVNRFDHVTKARSRWQKELLSW